MDCPYLEAAGGHRACAASAKRAVPDAEDYDNYCRTEEHYRCPALMGHVLRGGADRLEQKVA